MATNDNQAARLKNARVAAGWRSARKFANEIGVDDTTYRSHEMAPGAPGARSYDEAAAQRYADALGVNWMWLKFGEDVAPMTGDPAAAAVSGLTEAQAAAALRPIFEALGVDPSAARPAARGFLKAVRAAQALDDTRLNDRDFEIAGAYAAQEAARDWKKTG